MAWVLGEEQAQVLDAFFLNCAEYGTTLLAPYLLRYEAVNVCKSVATKQNIPVKQMTAKIEKIDQLSLNYILISSTTTLFQMAVEKNISAYDASYVWLTHSQSIPLCTLDKQLQKKVAGFVEVLEIE